MSLFDEYARYETRRQFFARGKNVLGYAALGSLLGSSLDLWGEGGATKPALPHFTPKIKKHHLPAHGRRSVPDGSLRLQAGAEGMVRQGSS